MEKFNWYEYNRLSKDQKSRFIGAVTDSKNITYAFVAGEEKKYKAALKKNQQLLQDA